jgi:endonuclease YncB( thermonuclease family)
VSAPFYRTIHGKFVITGKQPDGDSVRFIPKRRHAFRGLYRDDRIRPSRTDGSVQLRFEGVDAPELHYGRYAQPLGAESRDRLLAWMGFEKIEYVNDSEKTVKSSQPKSVPGAILTKAAETNGRPISYVLLADSAETLPDGDWMRVDEDLLAQTLNHRLLAEGLAYYTVYTSTPLVHRQVLRDVAAKARDAALGVWELDTSEQFVLIDHDSIGPQGDLILPKLFRRCTDYLKDTTSQADPEETFRKTLPRWLMDNPRQNDRVLLLDSVETMPSVEVSFSDLIRQSNRRIFLQADSLDVVFVEN